MHGTFKAIHCFVEKLEVCSRHVPKVFLGASPPDSPFSHSINSFWLQATPLSFQNQKNNLLYGIQGTYKDHVAIQKVDGLGSEHQVSVIWGSKGASPGKNL